MMPVGYRFHPTDQELINHYLKLKNQGADSLVSNIQEIDVCKWEPWELPGLLGSESDEQEWYFFGRRDTKYGKSTRSNRATKDGYWKPTGRDRDIKAGAKKVIGTKKTLVFYRGRAQKAVRMLWVMHEYCASADKHNPQAFVLYLLKKKTDKTVEVSNTDGPELLNISSPSASLLNNVPSHSPSTPKVRQGSANFSSSDQSLLTQNGKDQEAQSYPVDSYADDDIDMKAFESCFDGPPAWDALDIVLPCIPLPNVYPNQGPVHTTTRYLNVSNNDRGATQFQNIERREEAISIINSLTSNYTRSKATVPFDSESGTETDNDVPQSLFDEDALHGGSAYVSDSETSDQEFYNDMILAHEVSLFGNSDVTQHVELKTDKKGRNKLISGVGESAASNLRAMTCAEVPAQASGKKDLLPKKLASKNLEAVSDESSVESLYEAKSSRIPKVGGNKSSVELGKNRNSMGFIVYAENPRVSNGTTPPSNYIMNIAIGIFLTVVITGEVLFGLVS